MSEWKEYKLSEIAEFIDYRGKTPNKTTSGVPLITAKIVKNGTIKEPTEFISFEDYPKWMVRGFPKVGDVVLTTEAPLGEVAQIKDASFALAQRIITIRGKDGLMNNGYLKYFLQSEKGQHRLKERETGTTVTGIKSSELKQVLISTPDLPTQTAIAEILSSLDDKIELNNKINQELENLAQTLFKQWFIDFEFPNENGEPYKSSGGEMVDSELGEIPKGWEVLKIGEVLDFISGYPFKGASFSKDGNYGIVTIKNVQDGLFLEQIDNYIDELPNKFPVNTMLTVGDILMSLTGNVGRVCYVTSDNCLLNQRVVKFKSVQKNANAFWYYYFRQYAIKEVLISISKGTAQLNLSPVETKLLQCKLPRIIAPHILSAFDAIFSKQIECSMENKNLSNLRDTLLPKLISGELEINQITK